MSKVNKKRQLKTQKRTVGQRDSSFNATKQKSGFKKSKKFSKKGETQRKSKWKNRKKTEEENDDSLEVVNNSRVSSQVCSLQ